MCGRVVKLSSLTAHLTHRLKAKVRPTISVPLPETHFSRPGNVPHQFYADWQSGRISACE
jgi:hypothetical protein